MTESADIMTVHLKHGDVQQTFSGSTEKVWLSLNEYFAEFVPTFELAKRLMLRIDLQRLVEDCKGIIAFSKEGPSVLIPRSLLTDNETLALWFLAQHLGFELGLIPTNDISKKELQIKLGKSAKITSTRLSEFVKAEIVAKTTDDRFKPTIFGVLQIQKDILPRIKTKNAN